MPGKIKHLLLMLGVQMAFTAPAFAEEDFYLHQFSNVNGVDFDTENPDRFYVATEAGLFSIAPDGLAEKVSKDKFYLSEMARHPGQPDVLFASGYLSATEKLGIVKSSDGGKTWARIADGDKGPVAFYSMAISRSDPSIIYGVEENIQVSRDGGLSWSVVGNIPGQTFDIAVSLSDPERIYLATRAGLFLSVDGGKSLELAHYLKRPATMVNVADDGSIRAFLYNYGFISSADEFSLSWNKSEFDFVDRAIMSIAMKPGNTSKMLAVADTSAAFITEDAGKTWKSFEGLRYMTPERIARGAILYEKNCQECHGVKGIGMNPSDLNARDEYGLPLAPPMDDSAHAWHHPDEQIIDTILNGIERNELMVPWKEHGISRENAESVVAYIKSLWNFRSLACQGSRHMTCM